MNFLIINRYIVHNEIEWLQFNVEFVYYHLHSPLCIVMFSTTVCVYIQCNCTGYFNNKCNLKVKITCFEKILVTN